MKKLLFLAAAALTSVAALADDNPLWMRYPAISPDGKTIAFSYKGDIYTVPTEGGRATQLTTHSAYDGHPVWSPDGQKIAFASDREGSFDVFIMSKDGGVPTRLTTHSASEVPQTFIDNDHILFTSAVLQDVNDSQFPSNTYAQIYKVSTQGGRPELFSSLVMEGIAVNKAANKLLYYDKKGYEDAMRKHHQSSVTRDVWLCTMGSQNSYKKLTTFRGEDREPVWTPDEQAYYYLSERGGSFNVYKGDFNGGEPKQLTQYDTHPVRSLTSSADGLLCYTYNGEIYTVREGASPEKVNIRIVTDLTENQSKPQVLTNGATDMAPSSNGKEVAFILNGDVFVTSVEFETTKQITATPQQERDIDFSPDGRSIVYSSERGSTWGIYQASLVRKDDKYFTYAQEIKEEPLVVSDKTSFQPMYSPDGKEVAYLEDRTTLRVINLKTRKSRTVLDGKFNYSYSDGDISFSWSPDSKWLLATYIGVGGWNNRDVALVKADGSGEVVDLTESGYSDGSAKWVLDGKAMIWQSDRAGYRSHGSWGAEDDVYAMFFDGDAYDKFRMNKEEAALAKEAKEDGEKDKDKDKKEDGKKSKKSSKKDKDSDKKDADSKSDGKDKDKKVEDLKFDLDNRRDRIVRLTINSSRLGDAVLTPDGEKLYYQAAFEGGYDLWERNFKENSTKIVLKDIGGGAMTMDKKGENIFLASGRGMKVIEVKTNKVKNISFRAERQYQPAAEREYIFNHAWRQVKDKFYDQTIHGIDWEGYKTAYERFLPHINNNYDFQEMLSELLGELNGSHTGARFYPSNYVPATAALGAFYDNSYSGDGLKIAEVIANGPLTKADSKITAGCIVQKIDGKEIKAGEDYYPLLSGKAGKKVLLSVYNPSTKKTFEQQVKPISYGEQRTLLYKRWVRKNQEKVEELSGGRVAYVHVKGMDSESFRTVYSELLGKFRNKEAVIVDTRHNGGGWLHDDLANLLSGREYVRFEPRGQYIGSEPYSRWTKPSCVLVCEDNYSDAHGFPFTYKALGIGKLVGTPVPGTMTAVWWETQMDRSLIFGIPQVGTKDMQGRYLENQELQPDVEVYNTPEEQLRGDDAQLEKAVEVMLQEIGKK